MPETSASEVDSLLADISSIIEDRTQSIAYDKTRQLYWGDPSPSPEDQTPYLWQKEFHNAGLNYPERALMAANQTGKSRTGLAEIAMHAMAQYPPWWRGRRFKRNINIIVGSETNQDSRDITQKGLLGDDEKGTGWIPRELLDKKISYRTCGVSNVADTIRVRSINKRYSNIQFKTYQQGVALWRGTQQDVILLDEEPPPDIFEEAKTRLVARSGILMLTFTPHRGMGEVVRHFMDAGDKQGIYLRGATWEDAPHLNETTRTRLALSYSPHERDTRTKGIPMMGSGAVYPIEDETFAIDPIPISDYWRRIAGMDFGFNHPTAGVWLALNPENDVIYLYDAYRMSGETPVYHAAAFNHRPKWIPVAWPHDGLQSGKADGIPLKDHYEQLNVNMLAMSARHDDGVGGSQSREKTILMIYERMRTGRFKVFKNLSSWWDEKRLYHRKDGKIVKEHDDVMAATEYAVMMIRHATTPTEMAWRPTMADSHFDPFGSLRVQDDSSFQQKQGSYGPQNPNSWPFR